MEELYANETPFQIVLATGLIGGGAAWTAGRAIAHTWRPFWHVLVYMALLGVAVRFIHLALFEGDFLAPLSYAVDTAYLAAVASIAWRATRATQMATQYPWLYERVGLFTWRDRATPSNRAPDATNAG
jgi:hypothetical protein